MFTSSESDFTDKAYTTYFPSKISLTWSENKISKEQPGLVQCCFYVRFHLIWTKVRFALIWLKQIWHRNSKKYVDSIFIGLSQKRPLWSKAWCCVRFKFCSKLDDLRGGRGKSYRWFGVNRTWRFEGKSSVRFTPPKRQVRFGHMGLFIWHLVSRVFWVKFLFLSQHLKREVGFFNFTTLLLIIYSLLQ